MMARVGAVRLDPVGGLSGDMFIAAATTALPALVPVLEAAFGAAPVPPGCRARFGAVQRGGLAAGSFEFVPPAGAGPGLHSLAQLSARIGGSALAPEVQRHALALYELIAAAEAAAHGVAPDAAHFHELGDWDSVADVVGAAVIIAQLPRVSWSVGPLPIGSGLVRTAHGPMPVPAPATAWLLRGLRCHDDGVAGERVTPTGAAILRHLGAGPQPAPGARELVAVGCGAGSRELDGVPNVLRFLAFAVEAAEAAEAAAEAPGGDTVLAIAFEVDDQTPEDLARGLERLRAVDGVLDVVCWPAQGKKGRMAFAVRVLASPARQDAVVAACLAETATIGLRWRLESRAVLARRERRRRVGAADVRVKEVTRPGGGVTRKAAADDIDGDYAARAARRRRAEADDGPAED